MRLRWLYHVMLLGFFVLPIVVGAQTSLPKDNCIYTFVGTINQTIPIRLELSQYGTDLFGVYAYYTRSDERLWLRGTIDAQGQMTLREYLPPESDAALYAFPYTRDFDLYIRSDIGDSRLNGHIEGRLRSPEQFEGQWLNPQRTVSYPVSATRAPLELKRTMNGVNFTILSAPTARGKEALQVIVEGEQPVTISEDKACRDPDSDHFNAPSSIVARKLRGTPNLLLVAWDRSVFIGSRGATIASYHVFLEGDTTQPILEGEMPIYISHQTEFADGSYALTYEGGILTLTNHLESSLYDEEKQTTDVTEEMLIRRYKVSGSAAQLLSAKRRFRETQEGDNSPIEDMPWQAETVPLTDALRRYTEW